MAVELHLETGKSLISIPRILVVEDDPVMGEALLTTLHHNGFNVELAKSGTEGLQRLMNGEHYDMLLLDVLLPELDGWTVLSRIRGTPSTSHLPVIMLTAITGEQHEIEMLAAGADDYIPKPFSFENLTAHIQALLRRTSLLEINPLTKLPGNRPVERFLERCVREGNQFWAAAYIDLDNFKAYNDCYGFLRGDRVLEVTGDIILKTARMYPHEVFVGNIGGDDFIVGFWKNSPRTDESAIEAVNETLHAILESFSSAIKDFYTPEDYARGYIEAEGRDGSRQRYSLVSLSIAVVTNTRRIFNHPHEISTAFASVKRKAKSIPGNAICYDQRRR